MNHSGLKLQCPNCPNRMGSMALFCNSCGAALPASKDPAIIAEREEKQRDDKKIFGDVCGPSYHKVMTALVIMDCRQKENYPMNGYCPECGIKLV